MKKISFSILLTMFSLAIVAQNTPTIQQSVMQRPNDHLMVQFGYTGWSKIPDSIRTTGLSRHFNIYFLFNRPFKTNSHFSVAFGAGVGSSNIYFKNTYVDIKARSISLPFINVDSADHFKKYKLTTLFLEAPVELRFSTNPDNPDKSFKAAIGAKVGTLLKAYTKGKDLLNKSGASLYSNKYIVKESDKRFFNTTRFAVTGRVGLGNVSIDGSYQITNFLKENAGPEIRPFSIGVTLSGL